MRVLAVTHSLGANGAAWSLYDLLCAVLDAGGRADVLYRGDEPLKAALLARGARIVESVQTHDYDLALVNTLLDHARVPELAPLLPVVFWVHEGLTLPSNHMDLAPRWSTAFALSSRIVFQTAWQVNEVYKSFLSTVPAHRITVVGQRVSQHVAAAASGSNHTLARQPGERCQILSVGSVYPRKRPGDLAEVVVALAAQGLDVHCSFVGSLEALDLLPADMLALLRGRPDRFTLAGVLEPQQVVQQMLGAHAFCLTSGDESFSMAALDAAAMGLPLALSDLPGTADVWRHGFNALLAPPGAVDCLAWNLRALLLDRPLAARLGTNAAATAQRFRPQPFLESMMGVLRQTVADPHPALGS